MVDSIKITALQDIGANIAYTTLVPVVNMAGTPTTQKSNLQNLGNLILNGAGGSYFPRAAQATLALSVANAAQPNITSVGTLTSLAVTGNINAGNVNGGNIIVANYYYGDGGFLTNVSSGSNYSNSNVANYLPTYTGNVGANWVIASYFMGNGHNLTFLPGANVQGTVSNAAYAANAGAANTATTATTAGTVTTAAQPNITSVGTLTNLSVSGNATVSGNLTVAGNLVYVNVTTLSVVDPIIDLQTGPNGTPPVANSGKDVGTALNYYDTQARVAFMGWDVSNAEFGLASQSSITNEVVTFDQYGNLRVGNIIGNGQALTGINGANVTGIVSHANVAEYVNVQVANSNITAYSLALVDWIAGNHRIEAELNTLKFNANTHTLTTINVNANVITSNYFAGNGSNLSNIAGANVNGTVANANYATSAGSATTAGAVTTNAQPNITSVGTLSNLAVTGNVSANYFVGTATNVNVAEVNNNYSYHMAFVTGAGDTSLHMDADDNLQYNPADGTMTVTRLDSGYLAVNQSVISNLNPLANVTQDLGNTTNRWKDIWLANSTIHMGDATISANGNSIVVDSITVTDGNVGTIGNVASLNLDGSNSNVLYGNGVFAPISGGGGGAAISNGTSYANVVASDGNVVIGVDNDYMTWTFATDRKIYGTVDEDVQIVAVDDGAGVSVRQVVVDNALTELSRTRLEESDFYIQFDLDGSANSWRFDSQGLRPPTNGAIEQFDSNIRMYAMDAGSNPVASLQSVSNQNDPNIFTTIDATTTGANISVYNGGSNSGVGYTWRFDNNGLLTLPGNTVRIGSQYGSEAILASNVAFGIVSQGTSGMTALQWTDDVSNTSQFSAVYINDSSANVGDIQIRTGAVGNANIWKFGNDGNLTLPSNTFAVNYANGTQVSLGGGGGNTGNVTFDNVTVQGDNIGLNLSAGADFTANLAYLQVRAGDVASHIHLDTGNNSAYDLIVGDDQNYVQVSSTGNILLSSYDSNTAQYTWTLDYNGNLILAGGNGVIQSIANSSLDPTLPNVSTMVLTPDANYNSQVLVLDPTAPGHIHLRAFSPSNIDAPAANIFLGGEDTAFEITEGANNQAVIHSNGKAWTFGNDGNISSDTLAFTTTFANVKTVEYQTAGVWDLYVEDSVTGSNTAISRLNVSFKDNLIDKPQVYIENTKESDGIALRWTFDENGNLNFPRDVAGNSDPYLSIFGGSTPTIQSTDVSLAGPANLAISADYLNLSGFSGDKIVFYADTGEMATDANMTLTTNLANTGNTSSWVFGTDGNLTIPGTSGGFIKTVSNASIGIAAVDNGTNNPAQLLSLNSGSGAATSIVSAYSTNVAIQTNAAGAINTWAFDSAGNLTLPGNTLAINYANGTAAFGNIVSVNKDGNASNVLLGNGVFSSLPSPTSIVNGTSNIVVASSGNVTVGVAGTANVITATSTGANVTGTLNATGNVTAQGTGSNIIRRAFGLVASDVGVTLDDLTVTVSSATSQLTLSTSGSWQGTGWTETFAGGGTPTVNNWVNLPLNPGYNNASGAMTSQGNGCRCVISDQTPTAKVYQITVVRSGTSGAQWNISIERLV